jgi:DNA-binding IclR family transcriptional regulator
MIPVVWRRREFEARRAAGWLIFLEQRDGRPPGIAEVARHMRVPFSTTYGHLRAAVGLGLLETGAHHQSRRFHAPRG